MAKKQRNTLTGKTQRKADGKFATTDCPDCPCDGTGGLCPRCSNLSCVKEDGTGVAAIPRTYKVVVTDNSIDCTGCDSGTDVIGGNGNRTYYVGSPNCGSTFSGFFFAQPHSNRGDAPQVQYGTTTDCPLVDPKDIVGTGMNFNIISAGTGTPQQIHALHATAGGVVLALLGTDAAGLQPVTADTTDFCYGTTVVTQTDDCVVGEIIADVGTYTFTPCPPCAVDCAGPGCAVVTLAGTCATPTYDGYAGKYVGGTLRQWDQHLLSGYAPGGCVWGWLKGDLKQVIVWFDGYEYQCMILDAPDGDGIQHQIFYSRRPADLMCNDGTLEGEASLTFYTVATGQVTGDLDDCIVTVSFGTCDCPTDCTTACARVEILIENFTNPEDSWVAFEKDPLSGFYPVECVFTSSGCRLECIDGFWVATVTAAEFSSSDDPRGWKAKAPVDPEHPTRVPSDPALWVVEYGSNFGGSPMDVLGVRYKLLGDTGPCTPP